ncbi:oxaloacetate decarboxylase [Pseudohongiella nitratireducens]|uniref:Oxaloacetate decarboxylase n=1 Tax=Pseudohongiella nitratireducens TaxID=1768907 RepID=A0A917GV77_9GAMM|nr:sodium-extruding oxaloacetate decarboxylase subunit alpha [Pseudohongiella nitratireducens]MDF1623071.1 sodium-extruding oxaloacetate decarboxylase subunit alpha [Pseudohongiella nitratireducens]GGG57984.1 oxaloacetate decarboxylase [Pseudohongiella nitratireducens]
MSNAKKPLAITDVILRDAHQSLLATRMRLDDMLPIAEKLDQVGFWAVESWGGATFDACIRYLGEDPWERIRKLKEAMPNTPQQMLFRGQNILGYRHYADDIVDRFVERAAVNGVDVFRVFDAMNDVRNLETAIRSVKKHEKHAQGTMSYTVSPVHTLDSWLNMAKQIEEMGADSLCIKDMAGLLAPYTAYELISNLKKTISIPVHMQCHATTGLSTATYIKAVEAGIDNLDTAISSMSLTYGHTPTETMVAMLEGTERDTGLNIVLLEEIASYFREIRMKYAKFEGSLKGIDSRILVAQVPGGMLTNLENQLREQKATDRMDEVLEEIPRVREDLGFIPLVTPTSQIVGTQSVLNVLSGERYKTITKETEGVLKGEYGATPAKVNQELQERVLAGGKPITCRPAELLEPEFDSIKEDLLALSKEKDFEIKNEIDDTLSYALFPHTALKFFMNRDNPDAFEPVPEIEKESDKETKAAESNQNKQGGVYTVEVDSRTYLVRVSEGGDVSQFEAVKQQAAASGQGQPAQAAPQPAQATEPAPAAGGQAIAAPLSGIVHKVFVKPGESVSEGDVLLVVEAMKMETEIKSDREGTVQSVHVSDGDAVESGDALVTLG